jgi:hypothetical protein
MKRLFRDQDEIPPHVYQWNPPGNSWVRRRTDKEVCWLYAMEMMRLQPGVVVYRGKSKSPATPFTYMNTVAAGFTGSAARTEQLIHRLRRQEVGDAKAVETARRKARSEETRKEKEIALRARNWVLEDPDGVMEYIMQFESEGIDMAVAKVRLDKWRVATALKRSTKTITRDLLTTMRAGEQKYSKLIELKEEQDYEDRLIESQIEEAQAGYDN